MDDLSADLRPIVDAARAPRLTRSEKSRMWQRLEEAVDKAPSSTQKAGLRFLSPWLLAAALPLAGLLGFVVGAERAEPVAGSQAALDAHAPRSATNAATPPATIAVADTLSAPPLVKAQLKTPRTRAATRPKRRVTSDPLALAAGTLTESAEHRAVAAAAIAGAPARAHVTAPSPGSAAEHSESLSVNSTFEAEEPLAPVRRVAAASPAARAAAFRAKLEEESRARYQAALAQHARSASIRRPLSSVAGYAAW